MSSAWNSAWSDAWADSWGTIGIGLAFGPGIGLAIQTPEKPVDFVYSTGWSMPIPRFRPMARIAPKPKPKQDNSEFREMMELYSQWRKAA